VKAAVIQFTPGSNRADNIRAADGLIAQAILAHAPTLVALPEMWTCLGGDRAQKLSQSEILPHPGEPPQPGTAYAFLAETAQRHRVAIHGGSLGEREGDQLFNTSILFSPDGSERARYRKIHLFDITTPGGQGYRESALFGAGDRVVTAQINGMCAGLTICYDLRFGELFAALRAKGSELIFVPSAFTVETGRDHWEVLLRARAIETQCWIVAAATTGEHHDARGAPRHTWGHSLIIDPWGNIAASLGAEPGVASADIDPEAVERIRAAMPVAQHRRLA
jgi:nitrilase